MNRLEEHVKCTADSLAVIKTKECLNSDMFLSGCQNLCGAVSR